MSRIGKLPVEIVDGVKANVAGGLVTVEGPLGKLEYRHAPDVKVEVVDNTLVVQPTEKTKQAAANYGTTRSHLNNMVLGVKDGWKKSLELSGVGFTAQMQGQDIVLTVGYSHDVTIKVPEGVKANVQKTSIDLESCSKEQVGTLAARIRKVNPPEPYLGKGIKYKDEVIRRKAGKTGK